MKEIWIFFQDVCWNLTVYT